MLLKYHTCEKKLLTGLKILTESQKKKKICEQVNAVLVRGCVESFPCCSPKYHESRFDRIVEFIFVLCVVFSAKCIGKINFFHVTNVYFNPFSLYLHLPKITQQNFLYSKRKLLSLLMPIFLIFKLLYWVEKKNSMQVKHCVRKMLFKSCLSC